MKLLKVDKLIQFEALKSNKEILDLYFELVMITENTAMEIGHLTYGGVLGAMQSQNKQTTISIPDGLAGNYYLFIYTDYNNVIAENGNELNNVNNNAIQINLAPWADLEVQGLTGLPTTANAGTQQSISFVIENKGTKDLTEFIWNDHVYLSPDASWNPENAELIDDSAITRTLLQNENYSTNLTFTLPMLSGMTTTKTCYLYIFTDADNSIYEHTAPGP